MRILLAEDDPAVSIVIQICLEKIGGHTVQLVGDGAAAVALAQRESFDLIVLDPPKFVDSKASLNRAARGYKDVNLCALRLLAPGGRLFTFSCSGLMEDSLFQKIVSDAALDATRTGRIVRPLTQSGDHPVSLAFPEGAYLKGLEVLVD